MAPEMAREIPEGAEAHPEMRGAGEGWRERQKGPRLTSPRSDGSTTRQKTVRSRDLAMYPDMRWPNPKYKRNETAIFAPVLHAVLALGFFQTTALTSLGSLSLILPLA